LGKIGKKKALKNVRKRLKIFENIRKRLKIFEKVCEIFENIQKFEQVFPPRRHEDRKKIQLENSKSEARNSPQDTLRWKQIRMFKIQNSKLDADFTARISHKDTE